MSARRIALSVVASAVVGVGLGSTVAAAPGRAATGPPGVLSHAGWLFQAEDSAPIQTAPLLPALRFPPGTTYRVALTALVRSVAASGRLPKAAVVVAHLPRGAVWAPSRTGPRLTSPPRRATPYRAARS